MKLVSFQVTDYKNVEDSGEIKIDRVTCLVGKNESGKTALFEALAKLNPIEGVSPTFELEDYPRRKYSEYKKIQDKNPATAIRATFEITPTEKQAAEAEFGTGIFLSDLVKVEKNYKNKRTWEVSTNESVFTQNIVNQASLDPPVAVQLSGKQTIADLLNSAKQITDQTDNLKKLITELEARKSTAEDDVIDWLVDEALPEFFYFESYTELPGIASLTRLKQVRANKNQVPKNEDRVMLALIDMVGATEDEFMEPKNHERLMASLEASSIAISDQVTKYWSQNKELQVEFEPIVKLDSNEKHTDTELELRIKNTKHRVTVPYEKRSRGFVWFVSFLVAFSQYKGKGERVILLLDEPGLSLHAKAQWDLLNYIDKELAPHHQVLYSTHSPFMIEPSKLENARTVEDVEGKGVVVSNDPLHNDPDTVFPLQAALGYELVQTLFIGANTLLVEGPSDMIYINLASAILQSENRVGLSPKWVIVPVGGADKVATFVSLLKGNKINVAVLLDVSQSEQQRINNLMRDNLLKSTNLITVGSILNKRNADIEDLFTPDAYLEAVNSAYAQLRTAPITIVDITPGDPRIALRIQRFFEQNSINGGNFAHYPPAYEIQQKPTLQTRLFDTAAKNNFETAFQKINALLI